MADGKLKMRLSPPSTELIWGHQLKGGLGKTLEKEMATHSSILA